VDQLSTMLIGSLINALVMGLAVYVGFRAGARAMLDEVERRLRRTSTLKRVNSIADKLMAMLEALPTTPSCREDADTEMILPSHRLVRTTGRKA